MGQKYPRQIQAELAMPFAPDDLEWRLQRVVEAKELGIAVPYVTNRAIMGRLDDVVRPENWYNDFKPWHGAGRKEAQLCGISIRFGDEWITKWDGAEDSDIEPVKGGLSDSMKRAAVQWGVGRVLYNMDVVFVDVEKKGKTWYIKKDQQQRMDNDYLRMLGKLGLTLAPAGGLRPQAGPEGGQPQEGDGKDKSAGKPTGTPQGQPAEKGGGKPAGASKDRKDNITYLIRNYRVNKGMNSANTQLILMSSTGERIEAYVRGAHPELVDGVTLANVKMELKKMDTVIYYVLESYEIADAQPKAA
jgi:hypothetical protein